MRAGACIIGACLACLLCGGAAALAEPAVPSSGHTAVFVGQYPDTEAAYVQRTGQVPDGFMSYAFLENSIAALADQLSAAQALVTAHPGVALQIGLTLGPSAFWSATGGSPQVPGAVQVVQGNFDPEIAELATWLKQLPATVYLRVGYEFDLLGGQWGTPDEYRAAYRYVVDHLRAAGVNNVLYVWHSAGAFFRMTDYSGPVGVVGTADRSQSALDPLVNALDNGQQAMQSAGAPADAVPLSAYYPGPGYVDLFGISYWDDACCGGRSSAQARAVYRRREGELIDQAHAMGLPAMICESTPAYIGTGHGADTTAWFGNYFALADHYDLRAISYISDLWKTEGGGMWSQPYWNGFWPDARVWAHPEARAAWQAGLVPPRYDVSG